MSLQPDKGVGMKQKCETFFNTPHRRLNVLTNEWIQVSPHRTQRPWQGHQEESASGNKPTYDPGCFLCPGNARAGGKVNPDYTSTFAFDNDFSVLLPDVIESHINEDDLLIGRSEKGICRVICFSPRHDLTLPEMSQKEVKSVVNLWVEQYLELGERLCINYVQTF